MDKKVGEFDLNGYLQESGLNLVNITEEGKYIAQDGEGNEGELDIAGIEKEIGASFKDLDVTFNSPDQPMQKSPVGLADRWKLDIGNEKGSIKYLKDKFEDVVAHPDHGLIVKNNGVWQQVDPDGRGVGNAWEMAEELFADIGSELVAGAEGMDIGASLAGGAAGLSAGALAGGLAGSVIPGFGTLAGAIAGGVAGAVGGRVGGAYVGSKARMSLGRAVGTYEATDEEMSQDAGFETLMALVGEVIGPAGKAITKGAKGVSRAAGRTQVGEAFKRSLKNIKESTSGVTRDIMATASGFFAGAPKAAADDMIDFIDEVDSEAKNLVKKVLARKDVKGRALRLTGENVNEVVREVQLPRLEQAAEAFDKAVFNKFKMLEGQMLKASGDFQANISANIVDGMKQVSDLGLVKVGQNGKYELADRKFLAQALTGIDNIGEGNFSKVAMRELDNVVQVVNKYKDVGELRGKAGAKAALDIKRAVDEFTFSMRGNNSQAAKQVQETLGQGFYNVRNNIVENFTKNPNSKLSELYGNMNKTFTDNLEALTMAKSINKAKFMGQVSPEAGLNNLYAGLTGNGKAANNFQRNWQTMSKFFEENGIKSAKENVDKIRYMESAKYYAQSTPAINNLAGASFLALQGAAAGGAVLLGEETNNPYLSAAGLALGASVSPRLNRVINKTVLKTPSYLTGSGRAMLDTKDALITTIAQQGPSATEELMRNPSVLIRTITQGMTQEQAQQFMEMLNE